MTSESNFKFENEAEVENDVENNSQKMESNVEDPEQPSSSFTSDSS